MRRGLLTAPLAATGLIAGYTVATASGARPLGGLVMAGFGIVCIRVWLMRDGRRTAAILTATGLLAFGLSHVGAEVVGAWPAVLLAAAATAGACWRLSDARARPAVGASGAPARIR
jgi:tetrahydromethanopterin S-methyltransferase subunit C